MMRISIVWAGALAVLLGGCFEVADLSYLDEDAGVQVDEVSDPGDGDDGDGDIAVMGCDPDELGRPCSAGVGACARVGEWICEADQLACDAEPGSAGGELCGTGSDEDCDGVVDEAPEGGCCSSDDCVADQICDQGDAASPRACVAADPAAPCGGADLMTDAVNCGTCGNECAKDETCDAGNCVCPGDPDLMTDDQHCGACGNACAAEESCVGGACEVDPPACEGADLMTDAANCGTCGNACAASETCSAGSCVCPGAPDLMTDDEHCGACGNACASDESCVRGLCEAASFCGDGMISGSEECDPALTNDLHCDSRTCVVLASPSAYERCDDNDDCAANESCSQTGTWKRCFPLAAYGCDRFPPHNAVELGGVCFLECDELCPAALVCKTLDSSQATLAGAAKLCKPIDVP